MRIISMEGFQVHLDSFLSLKYLICIQTTLKALYQEAFLLQGS